MLNKMFFFQLFCAWRRDCFTTIGTFCRFLKYILQTCCLGTQDISPAIVGTCYLVDTLYVLINRSQDTTLKITSDCKLSARHPPLSRIDSLVAVIFVFFQLSLVPYAYQNSVLHLQSKLNLNKLLLISDRHTVNCSRYFFSFSFSYLKL